MAHRILGVGALAHTLPLIVSGFISTHAFASGPGCEPHQPIPNLEVRNGFTDFMADSDLVVVKSALPTVANVDINAAMRGADTMWYDEASMVFLYQDSVESVVGGRANCVGRMVGERNRDNVIGKLLNYFGPDYKFLFPFRKAAGTDNVTNSRVVNFWLPPKKDGRVMPVKYWKQSNRGRWHWVFPVGTLFGEVLFQKGPDGNLYPFEVRTRKRYLDGWAVDMFRPFTSADALANAIVAKRPEWEDNAKLKAAVTHLRTKTNLTRNTMHSVAYSAVFPDIVGALDIIPDIGEARVIAELLRDTTFQSVEGKIWKEGGGLETYAPGSGADFGIVPKGYEMGMIPVNEVSCNRCHVETAHPLEDFESDLQLYGEVWGEDRTFTWHLFEPNDYIFDTWDQSDSPTRRVNPRLTQANLIIAQRPAANDPDYKQLPVPF